MGVRDLSELEVRVASVLALGGELRKKIINIAATRSPAAVYGLAEAILRTHGFVSREAESIAKACRWLAIIRRDYGQAEFDRITAEQK